jgi:nicotinamidase-related amidase
MRHPGFGERIAGGERPALIVVDVSVGFTDPASPLACDLEGAVGSIQLLLRETRRAGLPVIFTTVAYDDAGKRAAATFIEKVPALLTLEAGSRWVEIDPRIAPVEGEAVLMKSAASAFFGTPLASILTAERCDTVIVSGASTSGCVRATAVDALQHGYRVLVPREAVGDRNPAAHEANLYDLDTKYGDVVSLDETVAYLEETAAAAHAAREA